MNELILLGLGAYESDPDEEFLVEYDAYIRAQVWKAIQRGLFTTVAFDLEVDELVQTIRIKLWDAYRKRTINNPRAYIRKIAYTTAIDMVRRYRSNTSLPTDTDGDLCLGDLLVAQNEGYQDPAYEIELKEIDPNFIEKLMQGILSLPPRQRQALLYSIREHQEESLPLIRAFKAQGLDIESLDLSDEECEVHLLKASLSVARKKLQRLYKEAILV